MTDEELKAAKLSRNVAMWTDNDKHIALNYIAARLATDEADRIERAKPIGEEWMMATGWKYRTSRSGEKSLCLRLAQHMGDDQWVEWDWRTPTLYRLPADVDCNIPAWVGLPQMTTRGQLLDLLRALKGGA